MKSKNLLLTVLHHSLLLSAVFVAFECLRLVAQAKSPLVVVTSESMEPAFSRGDVLFVWNRVQDIRVGDIAVCWFEGRELPMVHRIISRTTISANADSVGWHASSTSTAFVEGPISPAHEQLGRQYAWLTKGDNSPVDDRSIYPPGKEYLGREDIVGIVKGYLPGIGWAAIFVSETINVRWLFWAFIGLSCATSIGNAPAERRRSLR